MAFKVFNDFFKPLVEIKPEPIPKPEPPPPPVVKETPKKAEVQYVGGNKRLELEKKLPTPYGALEKIKKLPKPDPTDKEAIKSYKQQVKGFADDAIKNSKPPTLKQYLDYGLNGATANYEYESAKTSYDKQIKELKIISTDAEKYPEKILTPGEAVDEINKLPRPDRNDPESVKRYNTERAKIANSALLYAKPPKMEDYKGLNGATRRFEYNEALSYYNKNIAQLKEDAGADGTTILPVMTEEEANAAAEEYIKNHNGVKNEDDAYGVGKDVAELAKTDPEGAAAVMKKVQEKLNSTNYGDNVASGFVNNSSVEELREFSKTPEGEAILRDLQKRLTTGSVHDNEIKESNKIEEAITGFNPESLTGDPEKDAKTVDEQLKKLPPDMQEKYVKELLNHPYGQDAIKYARVMSPEGRKALGESLGKLYEKDPSGTKELLKQITNGPNASLYPYYYQSGLADAISKSGNDELIKAFAQNEIDRAKSNPDEVRGYLNAVTAYAGLSPEALQEVMKNNPDFYKTVDEAGKLIGGPASSGGFENGNIWESGLGDLLEKASQIKDANGNATPESIKLFETVVKHAGSNFRTMEGLGAFFVEHAQQLVDKYTDPLNKDTPGSTVLQDFFGNVVFSRIGNLLTYKGGEPGSLVDAIMGNEKGEGGVIGDIVDKYINAANKNGGDSKADNLLGQRIGFLWSSLTKGFLKGVQNYKDDWMDDKKLRDFTFDMLGRGLGKIASKFGLPGEVVSKPLDVVQGIYDAKAEKDKEKQLEMFKKAFADINDTMFTRLNNFENDNPNVEGLHGGFVDAYNWQMVQDLLNDVITE